MNDRQAPSRVRDHGASGRFYFLAEPFGVRMLIDKARARDRRPPRPTSAASGTPSCRSLEGLAQDDAESREQPQIV
jgi:hypothetical protein